MFLLFLSILGSSCLPLLFKAFQGWGVSIPWAVSLNYLICAGLGLAFSLTDQIAPLALWPSWTLLAVFQGILLACNFYLLAHTAQRAGVAIASLSSRLSVAIPVVLAIPLYAESLNLLKVAGILAALLALYLASTSSVPENRSTTTLTLTLPLCVFFSFGLHFSLLKYVQHFFLGQEHHHHYLTICFFFALLFSISILLITQRTIQALSSWKTWLGGLCLGICNYFAIFFMTRVLSYSGWQSSVVFPTHSVGVVIISTLAAVLFFSESLSPRRSIGLIIGSLAVIALNNS